MSVQSPTVPNQKSFIINKEIKQDFLQVENNDWMYASSELTFSAFKVYLYLAKNQNGYKLDYSPQHIENLGLMAKGTASKVKQELIDKGYIIGNIFYTRPPKREKEHEMVMSGSISKDDF